MKMGTVKGMPRILWGFLAALFLAAIYLLQRPPVIHATAVIGGEVTWVAAPGTVVAEGSELVRVAALAGGEAAAVRARAPGIVREVWVQPGEKIASGAVVARIERGAAAPAK